MSDATSLSQPVPPLASKADPGVASPAERVALPVLKREQAESELEDLALAIKQRRVSFSDLFHVTYLKDGITHGGGSVTPREQAAAIMLQPAARATFERQHGPITDEYWCQQLLGSVVATTKSGLFRAPRTNLHSIVNWDARDLEVVPIINAVDRNEVRAEHLNGTAHETFVQMMFEADSQILDVLDRRRSAAGFDTQELALIRSTISDGETYYKEQIASRANALYFLGVLYGVVILFVLTELIVGIGSAAGVSLPEAPLLLLSFGAGALGAVFSILLRMAGEEGLVKNVEASSGMLRMYGALRPLIGAISASVIHVFIAAGLLGIPLPAEAAKLPYFFFAIGLLAGFSERWVRDVLSNPPPTTQSTSSSPTPK